MRRALAILKYFPALVCGLLVVAWVVSLTRGIRVVGTLPGGNTATVGALILKGQACIGGTLEPGWQRPLVISMFRPHPQDYQQFSEGIRLHEHEVQCPLAVLLTLAAPIAVGCFIRFRFPLWSYFAWTALLAGELAFYLR